MKAILRRDDQGEWKKSGKEFFQPIRQLALADLLVDGDLDKVGLLLIVNGEG